MTRYQTVRVSGRARGVLDALGGRTIRVRDPQAAGQGLLKGEIVESQRAVFLLAERDDAGAFTIMDVFADGREAVLHFLGTAISAQALDLLTDDERAQAIEAIRSAQARGENALLGIDRWARARFGRELHDVLRARVEATGTPAADAGDADVAWPVEPSKTVH
jgi:hypothetical protein